jgi:L-histidine N-alpha-methyltransferase
MASGDFFLLGADLIKDVEVIEAAYNDPRGITAEFNRNILRVVNRRFEADFDPEAFLHRAFYDPGNCWIEMRLIAIADQRVSVGTLDLEIEIDRDEEILTEISAKYDRSRIEALLEASGFQLVHWYTDDEPVFALALARKV